MQKTISIIVPAHNEEKNIPLISEEIFGVFENLPYDFEIIFVNDGSKDNSQQVIEVLAKADEKIKSIEFSKNFGKESATSAGLKFATGDAVIIIDADLQHPTSLIPHLIKKWEEGNDVVIGLRTKNKGQSFLKTICSAIYYRIINKISETPIVSGATDFRLIDRKVVNEFNKFTEHDRITRGLIDWLGFKRSYVPFEANERANGEASYSYFKLVKLALSSATSHSLLPLKFAGYLGLFIMFIFGIGGTVVFTENYIFHDILGWAITGTAKLAILMIFFIGLVLACLGLIALYIGNIHGEVSGRPLYVVRSLKNLK
jgi:glycosyltransferase involved in cell wall biosynthesis